MFRRCMAAIETHRHSVRTALCSMYVISGPDYRGSGSRWEVRQTSCLPFRGDRREADPLAAWHCVEPFEEAVFGIARISFDD